MLDFVRSSNFSSMFQPRLPNTAYLMSVAAAGKNVYNKPSSYLSLKTPVKAATLIHEGSKSEVIGVSSLEEISPPHISYLEIADDLSGRMYCVDRNISTSAWLKTVKIAEDCQSSNVELASDGHGLYLRSKKKILKGETLSMWFEASVLALLDMPYLTHLNIQGQNNYVCHKCNKHYERPNPLKIHLITNCNQVDDDYLWFHLSKRFKVQGAPPPSLQNTFELSSSLPNFSFNLSTSPSKNFARYSPSSSDSGISSAASSSPSSSMTSLGGSPASSPFRSASSMFSHQDSPTSSFYSASSTSPAKNSLGAIMSAFTPYQEAPVITPSPMAFAPAYQQPSLLPLPASMEVLPMLAPNPYSMRPLPPPGPDAHADEMEMIVSNMGKCKGGHICVYCGKVYSRKYGLKIHLRTHTGYKPLKCKFCNRYFADPSNMNKHMRLHAAGDTPYKCSFCPKVLMRRRDLERHIRSRHVDQQLTNYHMTDDDSTLDAYSESKYC